MNGRDRAAMRRAIALTRAEDEPRCRQVDAKLASEPWEEVGGFCAYHCQMRALGLAPWQRPPCLIEDPEAVLRASDDGFSGKHNAARLLRQMRKLHISKYDPDPPKAIAAAEAKARPSAA
jgi:hypothetical protein